MACGRLSSSTVTVAWPHNCLVPTFTTLPHIIPLTLSDWRNGDDDRDVWGQFGDILQDAGITIWPDHPKYKEVMPLQAKVEKFPVPNGYSFVTPHRGLEGKEVSKSPGTARELTRFEYTNDLSRAACLQNGQDVVVRIVVLKGEGRKYLEILRKIATGPLGLLSSNHTLPMLKEIAGDSATFCVFPMVGGGNLRNAYDGWAKTSAGDILDMVMQALEGLAFIHNLNIAHRDAFCDNFIVQWQPESLYTMKVPTSRPRVYLIDFETALASEPDSSNRTCVGFPTDEPEEYTRPAIPEMRSGQPYDPFKVDVWQFAMASPFARHLHPWIASWKICEYRMPRIALMQMKRYLSLAVLFIICRPNRYLFPWRHFPAVLLELNVSCLPPANSVEALRQRTYARSTHLITAIMILLIYRVSMSPWDTATLVAWVQDLPREAEIQFRQLRAASKEDLLVLVPYILIGLLSTVFLRFVAVRLLRRPLPPGPKVRTIPPQEPWKLYHAWARNSGPLMTITSLSQQVILLTNLDTVFELFEKRSLIYCNRPRWPMADLLGRQDNVGFTQYGERLRKGRRFLHSALNERYLLDQDGWGDFLVAHSLALLRMMVEGDPREAVGKLVETMIVQFAYGRDFAAQYGELARQVQAQTNLALQPGRWAVNTMPICAFCPCALEHTSAAGRATRSSSSGRSRAPPFERVKADMAAGTAQPSFVKHNLEEFPNMSKADERILIGATGSVYDAGVSTTVATLTSFLLFLSRHPAVQDKAHAELLRVLGSTFSTGVARLPNFADRTDLPYVDAVIQEIVRYNPPVPLVSHAPRKEDTFAGYRVPKGTWVTANIWSMLHDEETYPDPDTFDPESACPGLHLASQLTFLVVARTLALYTIVPASPADAEAPIEFATGLVAAPKPFKVRLVPRSGATEEMLAQALAEVEATVPARPPA
ncbi:hypothetical protein EVG20_g8528 [Dentipellis fragilis]|uniref:Protein kinase domain-containing protein n=1 Tax=Dentipellis fragilis TaxID=205917 RepID=A0A4Y9Y623_9AGAM|nr:hypothetical protein EVG20_g8528 [Dentipellis fragilis]